MTKVCVNRQARNDFLKVSVNLLPDTVSDQLIMDDEDEEVLQLIAVAIPAFRDDIEIQIAAAKALALVLADGK